MLDGTERLCNFMYDFAPYISMSATFWVLAGATKYLICFAPFNQAFWAVFIIISGICSRLSRNTIKRGVIVFGALDSRITSLL